SRPPPTISPSSSSPASAYGCAFMSARPSDQKGGWIRKLNTSGSVVLEVPLGTDEVPLDGCWVQEGCNITLTNVQIVGVAGQWWTFCFEAFGNVESAPNNLVAATNYATSASLPVPNGAFLSYPAWLSEVDATKVDQDRGG